MMIVLSWFGVVIIETKNTEKLKQWHFIKYAVRRLCIILSIQFIPTGSTRAIDHVYMQMVNTVVMCLSDE